MKILFCTDGSIQNREAAIKAADFIKNYREKPYVHVIYVHESPALEAMRQLETASDSDQVVKMDKESKQDAENILNDTAKVFEERGIKVNKELKNGKPVKNILKFAKSEDIDLIILKNRTKKGLQKFLLGSVSNAIAQKAEADVWIIK